MAARFGMFWGVLGRCWVVFCVVLGSFWVVLSSFGSKDLYMVARFGMVWDVLGRCWVVVWSFWVQRSIDGSPTWVHKRKVSGQVEWEGEWVGAEPR